MSSSSPPATFRLNCGARVPSRPRQPSQRSPSSMGSTAARPRRYDRYRLPVSPRNPTGQPRLSENSANLAATARSVPWPLPKICCFSVVMRSWTSAGTAPPCRSFAAASILLCSSCSIWLSRYKEVDIGFCPPVPNFAYFHYLYHTVFVLRSQGSKLANHPIPFAGFTQRLKAVQRLAKGPLLVNPERPLQISFPLRRV